ncbi:MAG: DUF4321 domain-containing protein [Firmicutes bacterium]|nr:DUF4321 domain-containing protein [Bacillota bacterium]
MSRVSKGTGLLFMLLIFGSIFGSLLGEVLRDFMPFLSYGKTVGFNSTTIDLAAITITLGLLIKINIATILGFFIALFIYTRL